MNLSSLKFLKPYMWRLICTALGFIAAVSFLVLGFGKTTVILLCCGIGYAVGVFHDRNINIMKFITVWRSKSRF